LQLADSRLPSQHRLPNSLAAHLIDRYRYIRFTLSTLLIATTLVAVVLGVIVYFAH
jgi:hypothetical protein